MGKYLAYQIILKKLMYNTVTKKYPKYKAVIDSTLEAMGWMIDSEGNCVERTTKKEDDK